MLEQQLEQQLEQRLEQQLELALPQELRRPEWPEWPESASKGRLASTFEQLAPRGSALPSSFWSLLPSLQDLWKSRMQQRECLEPVASVFQQAQF